MTGYESLKQVQIYSEPVLNLFWSGYESILHRLLIDSEPVRNWLLEHLPIKNWKKFDIHQSGIFLNFTIPRV